MSYQVLARKWRPSNFSEVAGQGHVLKSLINALDNERLHHAYLFTGTRGVGKTTLARILAKCLNCEKGISSRPCGACSACGEINEGRFIDLIEVDAASRTKVEDTRELLENVQYSPARGRFKVYLIDEVHMLSNHSFNALLKTLEEPPDHVKFLFATTDPQKLPVTILSRCLQFNLKNLSPKIIVEHLKKILIEEIIDFDEEALWQISVAATGSMRDALTLVDQGVSYCQGSIDGAGIVEMLGVPQELQVFTLLEAMAYRDANKLLSIVNQISEQTPDYMHTLDGMLSAFHRLAIAQVLPEAADSSFGNKVKVQELASKFSAEDLQLYYQIGSKGKDDLRFAVDMKSAFEMVLLRMLIFSPVFISDKVDLSNAETEKKKNELDSSIDLVSEMKPPPEPNRDLPAKAEEEKLALANIEMAGLAPIGNQKYPPASLKEDVKKSNPIKGGPERQNIETGELNHEKWLELYTKLDVNGIAANVLANTEFKYKKGQNFFLVLSEEQSAVYSDDILPKLSQSLSDYFGESIAVNIEIGKVEKETPAMVFQRLKQEAQEEMIDNFENDKNVQELLRHFSAKLAKESISPIKE